MARSFTGSDHLNLPNKTALDVFTQITVAAWVYPTSAPAVGNPATVIQNGDTSNSRNFDLDYRNVSGTGLLVELSNSVGSSFGEMRAVTTLSLNTWHNVVFTADWTQNPWTGTCYVDGSSISVTNSGTATTGTPNATSGARAIGVAAAGAPWKGNLAEIAVWKGVLLTALEAQALARGTRAKNIRRSSIVGYWPIDGLQSPEPDLSLNTMNGTLVSTVAPAFGPPLAPFTPRWPLTGTLPVPRGMLNQTVIHM